MDFFAKYWVYVLGFFAQALFGTRLIAQLILSEKKGKVVSPAIYWQLGVVGSFLFLIYGIIRNDLVIIFGQSLSYLIYVRNLQLKGFWKTLPPAARIFLWMLPFAALVWTIIDKDKISRILSNADFSDPIIAIGALGQLLLNLRYLYQWIYSEQKKESLLPVGFWIISACASAMIIGYSWFRNDPVLLIAQGLGIFVYVRNIIIHFRPRKTSASI